ncbi:MAG: ADP-forming succinate--CoA ligase subunit beta [Conexivisphaera sp.]
MRLYEYEGKLLFARAGIKVPGQTLLRTLEDAERAAAGAKYPVVLKAQVLVGGRGKAGGVKVARNPEEFVKYARDILGMTIRGERVAAVLAADYVQIDRELYLSIIVDRSTRKYVILHSDRGGVDIEEVAKESPEHIFRTYFDPFVGIKEYHAREVARNLGLDGRFVGPVLDLLGRMYEGVILRYHADLAEINPLAVSGSELVPVDAKVTIDDNAPDRVVSELKEVLGRDPSEGEIHEFNYVKLDGYIGIIGNGAGLTMATMDEVQRFGGKPADFLDIGGGAERGIVKDAVKLLLSDQDVKAIFVNILGGITRCDEVASGVVEALNETGIRKPIVIRLVGTNEEEGRRILERAGISYYTEMDEAAQAAVRAAGVA